MALKMARLVGSERNLGPVIKTVYSLTINVVRGEKLAKQFPAPLFQV
jgi:hypothetical protein